MIIALITFVPKPLAKRQLVQISSNSVSNIWKQFHRKYPFVSDLYYNIIIPDLSNSNYALAV